MPAQTLKTDKRLLGNWRSDRQPTITDWRFTKRLSPERRRKFLDIFGHLRLTYTRTRIRGVFHDHHSTQCYEVLATDSDTVAIRYGDVQLGGEWRIQHIHFEGRDRYWIALGRNREWFRRVRNRLAEPGSSRQRRGRISILGRTPRARRA